MPTLSLTTAYPAYNIYPHPRFFCQRVRRAKYTNQLPVTDGNYWLGRELTEFTFGMQTDMSLRNLSLCLLAVGNVVNKVSRLIHRRNPEQP